MKKVLLASMLGISALSLKAQTVELIPKAGINISKQAISSTNGEKSKVAFQGGLGLNIHTGSGGFSIQPEINYTGKGTKLELAGRNLDVDLNYIEIPVLAKYSFGIAYVNAGPSIGLMTDKKSAFIQNYGSEPKRFEFGVQMGAGVAFPVGIGKLVVDGRYALGLSEISKTANIKNRGIVASLGYAVPLGSGKIK